MHGAPQQRVLQRKMTSASETTPPVLPQGMPRREIHALDPVDYTGLQQLRQLHHVLQSRFGARGALDEDHGILRVHQHLRGFRDRFGVALRGLVGEYFGMRSFVPSGIGRSCRYLSTDITTGP